MKLKKILAVALALSMAVGSFAACGGEKQGDAKQVIDAPKEERTKQFLTRYTKG